MEHAWPLLLLAGGSSILELARADTSSAAESVVVLAADVLAHAAERFLAGLHPGGSIGGEGEGSRGSEDSDTAEEEVQGVGEGEGSRGPEDSDTAEEEVQGRGEGSGQSSTPAPAGQAAAESAVPASSSGPTTQQAGQMSGGGEHGDADPQEIDGGGRSVEAPEEAQEQGEGMKRSKRAPSVRTYLAHAVHVHWRAPRPSSHPSPLPAMPHPACLPSTPGGICVFEDAGTDTDTPKGVLEPCSGAQPSTATSQATLGAAAAVGEAEAEAAQERAGPLHRQVEVPRLNLNSGSTGLPEEAAADDRVRVWVWVWGGGSMGCDGEGGHYDSEGWLPSP
jgi:hypothetical protein